jgi:DNA-3-methyladenine glycosylase
MKLGAHLSIKNSLVNALLDGKKISASTIQIFSSPPRNWSPPDISRQEIKEFKKLKEKFKIDPVFIHSKYLVNLGSRNLKTGLKSVNSLTEDMMLAKKINARGVIFHPRIHNYPALLKNIKLVLKKSPAAVQLILENSSQMSILKIAQILKDIKSQRLKFCLDLAHAWQYGYNLNDNRKLTGFFKLLKTKIRSRNLVAIHANDSKTGLGSKHDRHENIGEGKISSTAFFVFLNHPLTSNLPFILETPGFKDYGLKADLKNLKQLKKLAGKKLGSSYFNQPALKTAKDLLNKLLIIENQGKFKAGLISETEAYFGTSDLASHASKGRTKRTKVMFGPAARLYIYLIYGKYYCLNIVIGKKGYPAAVLIRGLRPVFNIKGRTDGPGRLCQELGIETSLNKYNLNKGNKIKIVDIGLKKTKITALKRVGVDYAAGWADKKWRFKAG